MQAYDGRLTTLLSRTPRGSAADPNVLDPLPLILSPNACTTWIAFHDPVEHMMRPGGELGGIRAFGSKLAEHAGRLAGILTAYDDLDAAEISSEHMDAGIALAEHYAAELLRLGEAAAVSPDLQLAQRLVAWWQGRPDAQCRLADLYQTGLSAIRDAATARRIVGLLEEHGWVQRLPPGTMLDGAIRKEAWELVP